MSPTLPELVRQAPLLQSERLAKLRGRNIGARLEVVSDFQPAGDQPQAIDELIEGLARRERDQVLLGVTGSGKTFTMAHVIAATCSARR